jgi:glycosyltransferase involved in cell wall biosynthesis
VAGLRANPAFIETSLETQLATATSRPVTEGAAMNVLIVNKYFFVRGGPERYMFSVIDLLERAGHKVVPLAVRFSRNEPSPYSGDFLSPPAYEDEERYPDFSLGIAGKLRLLARSIYSLQARRRVVRAVCREKIDVVYLLNICNYISPSVIDGARWAGARIVLRLSDFNFVCASYHFLRDNRMCTLCLESLRHALRYRCARGSLKLSLARVLAMQAHRLAGLYEKIDAFVAPSGFMAETLGRFGAPRERIHHVPSFVDMVDYPRATDPGDSVLYCGRLDPEKGVDVLLRAWSLLGAEAPPLRILGTGEAEAELKRLAAELGLANVRFEGFVGQAALRRAMQEARIVLVPSLWPENSPMAVYEAMACARPVIASDIHGLREQIESGVSGVLVPPGDAAALAQASRQLWHQPSRAVEMGLMARRRMERHFSSERHLEALLKVFGAGGRNGS